MLNNIWLVIISATLYSVSLLHPLLFGWLSLLFLIPLCMAIIRGNSFCFGHGFLWGLIVNTVVLFPVFLVNFQATIPNIYRAIGATSVLITYFSVCAGLWFFISALISQRLRHPAGILAWLSVTFVGYFYFIHRFIMWVFDYRHVWGHVFIHPVIPLIEYRICTEMLSVVGLWGFTSLFVILSIGIAYMLTQSRTNKPLMTIFLAILFVAALPLKNSHQNSKKNDEYEWFFQQIGYMIPEAIKTADVNDRIKNFTQQNPSIRCIITPEVGFRLVPTDELLPILLPHHNEVEFIFGAFSPVEEKNTNSTTVYNTAYHVRDSVIVNYYHKYHLVPFSEYVPEFWRSLPGISSWFIPNDFSTRTAKKMDTVFSFTDIDGNQRLLKPHVCSDVIIADTLIEASDEKIILAMMRETFFPPYFYTLLRLFVRLKAITLAKPIVLINYAGGYLIRPDGTIGELKRV